jgi:hypothetical protein
MRKDEKTELLTSVVKTIFSVIPYAGTALTELVFDYNGRIKQSRLNKFVEILSQEFSKNNEIDIEKIKTENFNDLFESVIKRVYTTKSELKLNRFKDILIKGLKSPENNFEFIDVYLDLITDLSEDELIILYEHRHFGKKYSIEVLRKNELGEQLNIANENRKKETININIGPSKYSNKIIELEKERNEISHHHKNLEIFRKCSNYSISDDKFRFYKQRLYSKALLIDSGIGAIGTEPFEIMSITEFALEFINFIKNTEK